MIYPKVDGSLATINIVGDPIYQTGAIIPDWDGNWFVINAPSTAIGMIMQRVSSPYEVALWGDDEGATWSTSSGFLLLPPTGGFTGSVIETEYVCFYDSSTWIPSLTLPASCQLE
jgi:hypothetical protein